MAVKNRFRPKPTAAAVGVTSMVVGTVLEQRATARLAQEAANAESRANNTCWDDLNVVSNSFFQQIVAITGLMPVINNQALTAKITNLEHFKSTARVLARDMTSFAAEYKELKSRHAGRSGPSTSEDDNMQAVVLHTAYMAVMERFTAIVEPMYMSLVEMVKEAESRLREEDNDAADSLGTQVAAHIKDTTGIDINQTLSDAQDPNVITDVEVKGETVPQ